MKTYQESLDYLNSFISYEKDSHWTYDNKTLNLDRFKRFLDALGNPQHSIKTIHVAGSDGKGSTCAFLESILREMGFKTGLYTSPHLHSIRERIQINGIPISKAKFCDYADRLRSQLETMPPVKSGFATFFELLTAMAFLHFQNENVDFAVIETGLGGRLDATNVMQPILTAITTISLEHTDKLGGTLEKIADEKLGIIRDKIPIIIGNQTKSLLPHFKKRLKTHGAEVVFVDEDYAISQNKIGRKYRAMSISYKRNIQHNIKTSLLGLYQQKNAIVAISCLKALQDSNHIPRISNQLINNGFKNAQWPGRFEACNPKGFPTVIFDVAHTEKGAKSLRDSLDEIFPTQDRNYIFGVLQEKNVSGILTVLFRKRDTVILTKAPTLRGMETTILADQFENTLPKHKNHQMIADPILAFESGFTKENRQAIIIVTGSLYLVGVIRGYFLRKYCGVNVDET